MNPRPKKASQAKRRKKASQATLRRVASSLPTMVNGCQCRVPMSVCIVKSVIRSGAAVRSTDGPGHSHFTFYNEIKD